ncbi:PREDICTED: zinc finger CCCH domain-containing protein 11A [Acanthisitta chloris]|uniref:zinc finger CCCH domain-containing protein 11A n=1 Tax=Acanthisitta chloris TaxID=57068 RepID=UPI0004F0DA63|nr:PREDICTED: zinc finger CCCH domain-containing protein 11A [Acanthisitta chloris]
MSNQGDDCYFYFYSTCNKGDSCAFRHCEAALGSETVCTLWQEGRCFRNVCRFRHMEIDKKRSEIACYWENQPGGCQKYNCAFHHTKGRYIDGLFLPPSKTTLPSPPESAEDDVKMAQMLLQQTKLSVQSNPSPQLRGVMKVENSENVPSPTHPPVVINAADDDEDDDDQLSEEGEETKTPVQQPATETHNGLRLISTRKSNANTKQDDNLNFGIKTLEEIKLKKLKEKAKKQGEGPSGAAVDPLQARTIPVPEKENVRTVLRTVTLSSKEGVDPVIQLNIPDRLGKRKGLLGGKTFPPLRRNLAERLGRKTELLNSDKAPRRGKAAKPIEEIRVKTLEEIRLERANQRRGEAPAEAPSPTPRPSPAVRINPLAAALAEKSRKRLQEEKDKPEAEPKRQSLPATVVPGKVQLAEPGRAKTPGEVRIKTLEEIKREKALRMQQSGENIPAAPAQPEPALRERKLLRVTKLTASGRDEKMIVELNPKAAEPSDASAATSAVQVKSLEEIMWEKHQLKLRQEEKLQRETTAVPTPGEKPTKAKSKVCLKPLEGKGTSSSKQPLKRNVPESHPTAVVAVKPLSAAGGDTKELSAKKAAAAVAPALPEDNLVSIPRREKPQTSPELHLGSQADSLAQPEVSSSASSSSEGPMKMRRLSSTGSAKAPLSVEDDFEKLIWEISGGKLEAEIDLDPGKDEDDLLLELSEMIDS